MRAGIFKGLNKVAVEEIEKPELIPGSVIVRNVMSGICGTDVHAYTIEYESVFIFPGNQFGHEMAGIIDEVAEGVTEKTGLKPGDRVFVNPCTFKEPTPEMCAEACCDMAGAFSEYIRVDDPQIDYNIHLLPDNIPWNVAAMIEPVGVGMHGVMQADPAPDDKVVVYGGGPIGMGVLACLKARGCKNVVVCERKQFRLDIIEKIGGIPCDTSKTTIPEFVMDLWGTDIGYIGETTWNADCVIDCGGWPGAMEEIIKNAKPESKFVQIALGKSEERVRAIDLAQKGIKILGNFAYEPEHMSAVIEAMAAAPEAFTPMATSVYGLSQLEEAMEAACDMDHNAKVLLDMYK